ncbi:MAG: hypothetical protein ACREN5_08700, partial [Gemmatimonadales bacterium]
MPLSKSIHAALALLAISAPALPPAAAQETTYIAFGSVWKHNSLGNPLDGTGWNTVGFNDAGWALGAAQLGYGGNGEVTNIRGANPVFTTYYFRRTFTPLSASHHLNARLKRDDGCIVYLNGIEVARCNLPPGAVNFATSAHGEVKGAAEAVVVDVPIPADLLAIGVDNVVAVEVHQANPTESDLSFDLELKGRPALPALVTLLSPVAENISSDNTVTFVAKAAGVAPLASAELVVNGQVVSAQPIAGGPTSATVTFANIALANPPAGTWSWNVRFIDSALVAGTAVVNFSLHKLASAPLDPALAAPANGSTTTDFAQPLTVTAGDPNQEALEVSFFLRRSLGGQDEFTVAVLPDTQKYVDFTNPFTEGYAAQTRWIRDQRDIWDIAFVVHEGDIVENESNGAFNDPVNPHAGLIREWQLADAFMTVLDGEQPPIPFGVLPGNHDVRAQNVAGGIGGDHTRYNQFFPFLRFEGQPWG